MDRSVQATSEREEVSAPEWAGWGGQEVAEEGHLVNVERSPSSEGEGS